ncbi:MAG TPA: efflux transporter outer membrane subunit [Stellaceae bacterium]|jgi:multidrug efflux system outer membrane protein|nr:efflux transporter outer membrane subunit [Stellaceae bacterium]
MKRNLSRSLVLASSLASAMALAACTLEPAFHRPAAPVAQHYPTDKDDPAFARAYPQPAANSVSTRPAADIGWQDFFGDPRLRKLIEVALANNRDLRVAAINVDEARAQYRIQRADLFPSLTGNASWERSRTPAKLSPFGHVALGNEAEVAGNVNWELDFFGKLRSLSHAAFDTYLATAEARKSAELLLVSQVADQYLTLRSLDDELAVTRDTLATAQDAYKLAQVQYRVGNQTALDLAEAQTVLEQAQANLQSQIRLRAQAVNALVLLLGTNLPADLPPPRPLNDQGILADVPAGLPSDLLTRRPDIMQAEDTLRSANANIGAARGAFFPSITLTGAFGTGSTSLASLFKPGSQVWNFGPQVSLPIFDGGANVAGLELVHSQHQAAVAQYEKAIQSAFREVSDGLAARGTFDDEIGALEREVSAQQQRLSLSEMRFKAGIDSYLNVITAQNDLYSAQITLISARLSRLTNLVDLYKALGGGWIAHTGDKPRPADVPVDYGQPGKPMQPED